MRWALAWISVGLYRLESQVETRVLSGFSAQYRSTERTRLPLAPDTRSVCGDDEALMDE